MMNENTQLVQTVARLEKAINILERRLVAVERQNAKLKSGLSAAQQRIASLTSTLSSVRSRQHTD